MKPSLPQGTRDFGADTVRKRNFIFSTIRTVFELYGFEPLETPAFENLETLLGKYGEEGDKLIFKILNNGLDNLSKKESIITEMEKVMSGKNSKTITERALRYDLTIPFARYVAMNYGQLTLPFKRYQMQPVWRADRPQKGRYREFYQCDADVVGSDSLYNDSELALIYFDVFERLGIRISLKINSRKILSALAQLCKVPEHFTNITVAIDKLEKIGIDKVAEEMSSRGIPMEAIEIIRDYLSIDGTNEHKLEKLKRLFEADTEGLDGIQELDFVIQNQFNNSIEIDLTLARGLNYYTGIIYEVKSNDVIMGSIGGGGRYDDLTGLFGVPSVPGVGISFGVDRIYDVMDELDLFPGDLQISTKVLFFNMGMEECKQAYIIMKELRSNGISCELYHQYAKMDKQFKYAERKKIPYVVIIGSKELSENKCKVKHLETGREQLLESTGLVTFLQQDLTQGTII